MKTGYHGASARKGVNVCGRSDWRFAPAFSWLSRAELLRQEEVPLSRVKARRKTVLTATIPTPARTSARSATGRRNVQRDRILNTRDRNARTAATAPSVNARVPA